MIKCKYCELECKNKTGLVRHNKLAHNITLEEFKEQYKELYPKKEITDDMIECKLCNEYMLPLGMASHLSRKHNIKLIDYYNTYIKKPEEGKCKICGNPTSFTTIESGYRLYCSSRCANLDPDIQNKMIENSLKKYGVTHPFQSEQVKAKLRQTCLEKYGVDSYMKTDEFRAKTVEAILSEEVLEKRRQTNRDKYGVDMPFQSKEIQNKIKDSNISLYGVENTYQRQDVKEKIKQTNLERYGVENGGASKEAQQKIHDTRLKKSIEFCKQNNCIPLTELDAGYSVKDSIFHDKLLLFNDRYYVRKEDIDEIKNHTPTSTGKSVVEINVAEYIKSIYNGNIIRNTRSIIYPKELDIYIPDKNLAIEINGIWYHSTNNDTDHNYHLSKTNKCNDKNIRLIHITDWEWFNKQNICKSLINVSLGLCNTIYARKCTIKEISQIEFDNFLIINHLQGTTNAMYKLGLFYNNELVQVIGLDKSSYNENEIELIRYGTKLNTIVVGGLSKLIYHQPYKEIIAYIDRSKFNGNGYKTVGFIPISILDPSYSYYKGNMKITKNDLQKYNLTALLGTNYDSTKTIDENMLNNNWLQLYDSGMLKMKYTKIKEN